MGDMTRASLVADLKASMPGSELIFNAALDADYSRHLDMAALDMARVRPRTRVGTITLVADTPNYAAPADLLQVKMPLWGVTERQQRNPWDLNWPGRLPQLSIIDNDGTRELWLSPSPSAGMISDLGSTYRFYYFAAHAVGTLAADTTIVSGDRALLLLRAQAESMKEMAARNVHKPVALRDGLNSSPRNGTPAALYDQLMKAFEAQSR